MGFMVYGKKIKMEINTFFDILKKGTKEMTKGYKSLFIKDLADQSASNPIH